MGDIVILSKPLVGVPSILNILKLKVNIEQMLSQIFPHPS